MLPLTGAPSHEYAKRYAAYRSAMLRSNLEQGYAVRRDINAAERLHTPMTRASGGPEPPAHTPNRHGGMTPAVSPNHDRLRAKQAVAQHRAQRASVAKAKTPQKAPQQTQQTRKPPQQQPPQQGRGGR